MAAEYKLEWEYEILKEWSYIRIEKYQKRKENQLKTMEDEYLVLSAKIRFIIDVIEACKLLTI